MTAYEIILDVLTRPSLMDDPATARMSGEDRARQKASEIYWALRDAGKLSEADL